MSSPVAAVSGILETAVYVADLPRAVAFYEELFGFPKVFSDGRLCAFCVGERQVLLLFRQGATVNAVQLPGGLLPGHDGFGTTHFAFSIPAEALGAWEARLAERGVAVESRFIWESGTVSLYFRDPDSHLVELATPGLWGIQ